MVDRIKIDSEELLRPNNYTGGAYFIVNFAFGGAIKIVPYYESFSKEKVRLLSVCFKDAGINLRQDDILTMLHLVLLDLALVQPDVDTYFVGNAGFANDSFDFLKNNISKMAAFDEKEIFLCSFTLPDDANL